MITEAKDSTSWDSFLLSQPFRPFLQSWTMGEVYERLGQKTVRLQAQNDHGQITGICFGHVVPARRGRHIEVPYGPVIADQTTLEPLIEELKVRAREHRCSFIRLSPFWRIENQELRIMNHKRSPLHLLAEHLWYLPLATKDRWSQFIIPNSQFLSEQRTADQIFSEMRSTARNLIRRAEKDGVTIEASSNPQTDLDHFLRLHDETRKRHGFTPYTNAFFRAQVEAFAPKGNLTLYLARYQGEIIAASIHMHFGGETSYHHGASSYAHRKIPASYLLQWTAIKDALKRGDHVYNFWGIAPPAISDKRLAISHPFAGVTLFKTGFGGSMLNLEHCMDLPLKPQYYLTRAFEYVRKWKRGF